MNTVDNLIRLGISPAFLLMRTTVYHGYLRTCDGTITVIDAPGAGTGPNQGTQFSGINDTDTIVGNTLIRTNVNHGFLRAPDGTFIAPIDVPGAGTGPGQGPYPKPLTRPERSQNVH